MKVLVTGGTGAFGMTVCRQLVRAGADPVAMARREPTNLPAGVRFAAGDIRDPAAVEAALTGCDAVVHLAWFMGVGAPAAEIEAINIGGTATLLEAMEHAGVRRLVFTSSTTAYGTSEGHPTPFREDEPLRPAPTFLYAWQKQQVEELIAARDLDAVIGRFSVQLGRSVDNDASQATRCRCSSTSGGDRSSRPSTRTTFGRFLEQAVLGSWKGTVNLASPGSVPMRRAGELLGRRVLRAPLGASLRTGALLNRLGVQGIDAEVARVLAHWPVVDTSRLTDAWGFHPAWSQEDILRDQARSASRSTYLAPGTRKWARVRRLPYAATTPPDPVLLRPGTELRHAAGEGVRGELDTLIDPAYDVYSATNLSEAFPGPMTPLSLELAPHGIGAATDGLVQLFGLTGEVADLMRMGVASFGHHVYVNVSSARLMAELVPGATVVDVDRMYLGVEAPDAPKERMGLKGAAGAARLGARIAPRVAGLPAEVQRLFDDVTGVAGVEPAGLTDDQLLSHLELVHDLVCQAWNTSSTGNFLLSGLSSALDGDDHDGGSAGAATLRGVHELAGAVRRDPAFERSACRQRPVRRISGAASVRLPTVLDCVRRADDRVRPSWPWRDGARERRVRRSPVAAARRHPSHCGRRPVRHRLPCRSGRSPFADGPAGPARARRQGTGPRHGRAGDPHLPAGRA